MRFLRAVAWVVAMLSGILLFGIGGFGAGHARATGAAGLPVPLAGPGTAKLIQVSGDTWTTAFFLDTASLCLGSNGFDLVTGTPNTDTPAKTASYDGATAPRCSLADQTAHPVTEVTLTFAPKLSAVPQTATLTVTPPPVALAEGAPPLEVPLTVRRTVSSYQYLWIPVSCGAALAVLLVAAIMVIGVPGTSGGRRLHWGGEFWSTSLFASATWTFSDSWATNVTALSALVGTLLTASGTITGLIPGVDLGRFSLLIALAGGITVLAPLLFNALNSLFPARRASEQTSAGEVVAARLWVMLAASAFTVFGIGFQIGVIGWVLGYDLVVAAQLIRSLSITGAALTALLFLWYGVYAILKLTGQPSGDPKPAARASSFVL